MRDQSACHSQNHFKFSQISLLLAKLIERLLEKANEDKRFLRNMKNHYWARMHVCKVKMKMFQRRLSEARKRKKKTNPLHILAEASLTHHDTH